MTNTPKTADPNPLEQWLQTLNFFEATPNDAHLDDTVYLIKQYARLQISSFKQLQRDYKDLFGQECPPKMKRNDVILALLGRIQEELYQQLDPNTLPNHMTGIDFNEDALKNMSRAKIVRLVPGTVIERDYKGQTYVVFCRDGYYEYNQKYYKSLSDISEEIAGYKFSGPAFFSVRSRMYLL
jgi:hypothetical protein